MTFSFKQSTAIESYFELISKDGEPYASIIEIPSSGTYFGQDVNGLKVEETTVVAVKAALFNSTHTNPS
jgi:hypothetical protein